MSIMQTAGIALLASRVMGAITAGSAWQLAKAIALFVAFKTVMVALITVVLAVVLHNFVVGFITDFLTAATSDLPTDGVSITEPIVIQLTGLAAWIGYNLKVPESMSVYVACLSIAAVRSWVPFLR